MNIKNTFFVSFMLFFNAVNGQIRITISKDSALKNIIDSNTKITIVQKDKIITNYINEKISLLPNVYFSITFSNPIYIFKDYKNLITTKDTNIFLTQTSLETVVVGNKKKFLSQNLIGFNYYPQNDSTFLKKPVALALQRLPFIGLVGNNITYKENEKIIFLINGKERKGLGNNWNQLLQNINTEKILKIELIIDPPLRFKNEGYSAVINLLTIDENINGESGGITVNYDSRKNINSNTILTILNKKSDLSISLSNNGDNLENFRSYKSLDKSSLTTLSYDSILFKKKFSFLNARFDYGLRVDSFNDFGISFNFNLLKNKNTFNNLVNVPIPRPDNSLRTIDKVLNLEASLINSKRKGIIKSIGILANFSNNYTENSIGYISKIYSDSSINNLYSKPYLLAYKYNIQNTKNSKHRFEYGLQVYFKNLNTDFEKDERQSNGQIVLLINKKDTLLQNQISIKPYYSSFKTVNKTLSLRLDLFSEFYKVCNKNISKNYFFLPEIKLRLNKVLPKNSSFSTRISYTFRKPNIDYLNPLSITDNPILLRVGNINLKPEKNINLSIEYLKQKKILITNTLYFSHNYDLINQFSIYENNSFISTANNGSSSYFFAYYLRMQGDIKSKFFFALNPSFGYSIYKNKNFNSSYSGIVWSISSNGNYTIDKNNRVGFNAFLNGKSNNAQGYGFGTVMYNISYNLNIYKNQFNVLVSADNFLRKNRIATSEIFTSTIQNTSFTTTPFRLLNIALSYNFNNIKFSKLAKKTNININDQVDKIK